MSAAASDWMIYGANGYTGELIAREAARRGMRPSLAGRSAAASDWVIYGANGYTGELSAREAARRGMRPILAGRSAAAIVPLAEELGLDHRVIALEDATALETALGAVTVVLHCAGPFARTS